MSSCAISENATEYIPVIVGVVGITASLYNYYVHPEIQQSDRDIQLLTDFGTTALIGFMSTTILKAIRMGTCKVNIPY